MKTQPYNTFWQKLHNRAREKGILLRVMFELTYRCNFYCKHCYLPASYRKKKGELKTKEVFSILDQLAAIGCFYLGFTGGEPFVRKDIMQILRYAKRRGFELIIYTNGSLIDEKAACRLAALRPNKVDITIPAMSEKALEKITLAPGSHKRIFKAIDLLYKNGVNLGFKTCVLKENEPEIKEIEDFAASLGALHRLDDMLSPRLDGSKEPYRYRGALRNVPHAPRSTLHLSRNRSQVTETEMVECDLEDCDVKSADYGVSTIDLFKCGVGRTQAAITPFGELKMCLMIDYPKYKIRCMSRVTGNALHVTGNTSHVIRRTSYENHQLLNLKEAWEKLKDLVKNIKPDKDYKCDECGLKPYCKWCPAKAWFYNGSFSSCEPESRHWAELRKMNAQNTRESKT